MTLVEYVQFLNWTYIAPKYAYDPSWVSRILAGVRPGIQYTWGK